MDSSEIANIHTLHKTLPATVKPSVHDPIDEQAQRQTEAKMINSWGYPLEDGGQMYEQIHTPSLQSELEEVEQFMRNRKSVEDAAVVLRDGPDAEIVGFVSLSKRAVESELDGLGQSGDEYGTQHVRLWETIFDDSVYAAIENNVQPDTIGRDFTGWVSTYDGSPLNKGEMNEWLDDTIETILACSSGHPLSVLELGTGSGMVLFGIAKYLKSYLGLELSQTAVEFVAGAVGSVPDLANKVQMYQGTATDLHLLGSASPNFVVINSVTQYFPSRDYLFEVVEGLI